MNNNLHFSREQMLVRATPKDKDDLFEQLVTLLVTAKPALDAETVLFRLFQREEQSATIVGEGVAMPHALIPGLQEELLAVATLKEPLSYGTPDESPVRLVFLLLGPGDRPGSHIKALSHLARQCSDPAFLASAAEARDADELWRALHRPTA